MCALPLTKSTRGRLPLQVVGLVAWVPGPQPHTCHTLMSVLRVEGLCVEACKASPGSLGMGTRTRGCSWTCQPSAEVVLGCGDRRKPGKEALGSPVLH